MKIFRFNNFNLLGKNPPTDAFYISRCTVPLGTVHHKTFVSLVITISTT